MPLWSTHPLLNSGKTDTLSVFVCSLVLKQASVVVYTVTPSKMSLKEAVMMLYLMVPQK